MKALFTKVWTWIKSVINSLYTKVNDVADVFLPLASQTVEAIKAVIENKTFDLTVDVVKSFTPEVIDRVIDKVVGIAKENIPKIALQLQIIQSAQDIEDPNEKVREVLLIISDGINNEKWEKFLSGMAQEILYVLADGKITWGEAGSLVEYYYQNYVKQNE